MNPYDPIPIEILGTTVLARVLTLSGTFGKNGLDLFGRVIKPEKITLSCPGCGQEIIHKIPYSHIDKIILQCSNCNKPEEIVEFFVDPIQTNRLKIHDLFSTQFSLEKIETLAEDASKNFNFGFIDVSESAPLVEKSDLGIDFDDDDLLES